MTEPEQNPSTRIHIQNRPRRLRRTSGIRDLVRETQLKAQDLILPLFIHDSDSDMPIASMPGCSRIGIAKLVETAKRCRDLGIPALALFPALDDSLKDKRASESTNPDGLLQRAIGELKAQVPEILVIGDVAMDPYSSDGHDGYVQDGQILNDETLEILAAMATAQAKAGIDIVAPSDMMDGRVAFLRAALDSEGFEEVGILSYAAKYCSAFYGPFRDALDSAPRGGDKKTYQMDPANIREAVREVKLDIEEGADMVMVKPGMPYLDVIREVRNQVNAPLAAYQVSGEYAMLKAAAANGWLDEKSVVLESLMAFKRAGCDMVLTYFAIQAAQWLG